MKTKSLATQLKELSRHRSLGNADQKLLRQAAQRLHPDYIRRLIKTINEAIRTHKQSPEVALKYAAYDGRKICAAWELNGCLMGRSLNGEVFPIHPECVMDGFTDKQITA